MDAEEFRSRFNSNWKSYTASGAPRSNFDGRRFVSSRHATRRRGRSGKRTEVATARARLRSFLASDWFSTKERLGNNEAGAKRNRGGNSRQLQRNLSCERRITGVKCLRRRVLFFPRRAPPDNRLVFHRDRKTEAWPLA